MKKISRAELAMIIVLRILAPIFIFSVAISRGNGPLSDNNTIDFNMDTTKRCAGKRVRLRYRGDVDYSQLLNGLLLDGATTNGTMKYGNGSISILFDAGRTYRMYANTIKLQSGSCLIGADDKTVLSGGLIMGKSISNIAITNLSVRDGFGIMLENTTDVCIHSVQVARNIFHGLGIVGSSNIRVKYSVFERNELDGVYLHNVSNVVVERSAVRSNGRDGISMFGRAERIQLGNNITIMNAVRCGISISSSKPVHDNANSRKAGSSSISDVLITRTYISSYSGYASLCVHEPSSTVRIIYSKLVAPLAACYSVANARELIIGEKAVCIGKSVFHGEISRSECKSGIIVGDICAPLECGILRDGIRCSRIWSPVACCIKSIAQSRSYCACERPPCILSNAVEKWPLPCLIRKKVLV